MVKVKRKVHAGGPRAVKGETSRLWIEGPEESGQSHGCSTWCTEEQEYIEVMKMVVV